MVRIALNALAFALLLPLPARAILIRADRGDDEYVELATRYASAVPLGIAQGEGVLVAPRWILTAAHRAAVLRDLDPRPTLRIGADRHAIDRIVLHPAWSSGTANDLALVRLALPVAGVAPTPPCRERDEKGQGFVLVAHGASGVLGAATSSAVRRARGSINIVDEVDERTFVARIKAGDDASDLQGAALREETGAPAYLEAQDGLCVAGVLAAVEEARPDAPSGSPGEKETFVRASTFASWIRSVIGE